MMVESYIALVAIVALFIGVIVIWMDGFYQQIRREQRQAYREAMGERQGR